MSTDLDTLWEQLSVLHYRAGEYGDDWIEDGRSLAAAVHDARAAVEEAVRAPYVQAIREWAEDTVRHLPFEEEGKSTCGRCLHPWPCANARLVALIEDRPGGGE